MNHIQAWLYKQKHYRNSAWNQFQEFVAFQVIPFIVCVVVSVGITLALLSPLFLILWSMK